MSSSKSDLPDNDTVEQVFKALETETTALFEHLDLSFLTEGFEERIRAVVREEVQQKDGDS